jgi:hypothetical protein
MSDVKDRDLLEAIRDPNEAERVLAVSELVYGIESYTRVISLLLAALSQLTAAKNDDEVTRELYASKRAVDDINAQLNKYWLALRIHHGKLKGLTQTTESERVVH